MRYSVSFIFLWMLHSLSLTDSAALLHEGSPYYPVGELSFACKDPGKPSYGDRTGYDFSIGASVTFRCSEGFVLVGSDRLTCQLEEKRTKSSSSIAATWSDHIPVCVHKKYQKDFKCSTKGPKAPKPGRYAVELKSDLKSVQVFACDDYKFMPDSGDSILKCIDKKWSGTPLECRRRKKCSLQTLAPNTNLVLTGTLEGDTGRFSCSKGYRLPPGTDEEITCTSTGEWSTGWPQCQIVDCGPPPSIYHGVFQFTTTVYQSVVKYTCHTGYHMIGKNTITCKSSGQWYPVRVRCEIVKCPQPIRPFNGRVYYTTAQYNATARYACNTGYMRNGPEFRRCTENAQWVPPAPYCEVVDCLSPPALPNGNVSVTATTINSVATYYCNDRFQLMGGNPKVKCQADGTWTDTQVTCVADCGTPESGNNSRVIVSNTTFGSVAKYYCIPGYFMLGNGTRYCREDGTWSPLQYFCQPVNCGPPPKVENGVVIYSDTTLARSARYRCETGFELKGLEIRVCTVEGKWSGNTPTCEIIDCGRPPAILNGNVNFTGTIFTSIATYTCQDGYKLQGPSIRFCMDTGNWTRSTPTCKRITSCPSLEVPSNSRRVTIPTAVSSSSVPIGSVVYHICSDEFDLQGSSARKCQTNGKWSGDPVTCVARNLTCTGPEKMMDSAGRMCLCSNGTLTNCHRYRQDWLNLTSQQREEYITAVKTLSSDPLYQPLYRNLMIRYRNTSRTLSQSLEPSNTHFLPWNRYYLHQYEGMLRLVNPNLYIPYWDWTLLHQTPYQNPVFNSSSQGFGNSSNPVTKCVNEGPFRQGKFKVVSQGKTKCLRREYGGATPLLSRSELEGEVLVQPASLFERFFRFLTIPFLTVRCSIGGTMCDLDEVTPTNDPLYLLILSFIDSVWYRWQSLSEGHLRARYADDSTLLLLTEPDQFTLHQYHDSSHLPFNVSVEYGEPVDSITGREKRTTSFVASSKSDGDDSFIHDGPGLIHLCPVQDEFLERLELSAQEKALVKSICHFLYNPQ